MTSLSDYFYSGPVITNNNGRDLKLQRIDQGLTYGHILEGVPFGPNYDSIVSRHLGWAQDRHAGRKIIVLEPRLRPLAIPEDDLAKLWSQWAKGNELKSKARDGLKLSFDEITQIDWPEPVSIGSVCCKALFESIPIDEQAGMLSELFVIWFQDGFTMPIDPDVVEQIKSIDWENTAVDVDL